MYHLHSATAILLDVCTYVPKMRSFKQAHTHVHKYKLFLRQGNHGGVARLLTTVKQTAIELMNFRSSEREDT